MPRLMHKKVGGEEVEAGVGVGVGAGSSGESWGVLGSGGNS